MFSEEMNNSSYTTNQMFAILPILGDTPLPHCKRREGTVHIESYIWKAYIYKAVMNCQVWMTM